MADRLKVDPSEIPVSSEISGPGRAMDYRIQPRQRGDDLLEALWFAYIAAAQADLSLPDQIFQFMRQVAVHQGENPAPAPDAFAHNPQADKAPCSRDQYVHQSIPLIFLESYGVHQGRLTGRIKFIYNILFYRTIEQFHFQMAV